jgi:hypothetical protein
MPADVTKAGFQQIFEGGTEILSIRPQLLRGPLTAAKTVYEIRGRKTLTIRQGWLFKDGSDLQIGNIESIVLRTGPIDAATNAHDITFKTHGGSQYVWHNVPNAEVVKEFIQTIMDGSQQELGTAFKQSIVMTSAQKEESDLRDQWRYPLIGFGVMTVLFPVFIWGAWGGAFSDYSLLGRWTAQLGTTIIAPALWWLTLRHILQSRRRWREFRETQRSRTETQNPPSQPSEPLRMPQQEPAGILPPAPRHVSAHSVEDARENQNAPQDGVLSPDQIEARTLRRADEMIADALLGDIDRSTIPSLEELDAMSLAHAAASSFAANAVGRFPPAPAEPPHKQEGNDFRSTDHHAGTEERRPDNAAYRYPPTVDELRVKWGLRAAYTKRNLDDECEKRYERFPQGMSSRIRSEYQQLEPHVASEHD